jgi:ketosteroid isomerase-like protein
MAAGADFIRSLYAAFGRGDMKTIFDNLDPAIIWTSNREGSNIPWSGTWRGASGVASFFEALSGHLDFKRFEPRDFFEADGTVVVLGYTGGRMKHNGQAVEADGVHVYTIANGKVARFQEIYDTAPVVVALAT